MFAPDKIKVPAPALVSKEPLPEIGLLMVRVPLPPRVLEVARFTAPLPLAATVPASRRTWFAGEGWADTPVVDRAGLAGGARRGPLIIQEYDATCLVPHGWSAGLDPFGNIRMTAE